MIEDILEQIYNAEKHEPSGYSTRLYDDLSAWVNEGYDSFNSDKLRILAENLDSKLPKEFNYQVFFKNLKHEIIELRRRRYSDRQIGALATIIGVQDLLQLEAKIKKPSKTIIGTAVSRYLKSLATKSSFISCVNNYFRNYTEIVYLFDCEGRKIAKSIALKAFFRDSLDKALERGFILYENYQLVVGKYTDIDEDVAGSIAIRAFSRPDAIKYADKLYQSFSRIFAIYCTKDVQLAKSVAHWTFMANDPEEQARRLYRKLKKESSKQD